MKQIAKYFIVLLVLTTGGWLITHIVKAYQVKNEIENRIQTLQHYSFKSTNGNEVFVDSFNPQLYTVIVYFHPECEHCQYEASQIGLNAPLFEKANMILITPDDSLKRVDDFAIRYHLWEVDNLTILVDENNRFSSYFGTSVIPSVFIYGIDKRLLKMFKGEVKIKMVLDLIHSG